MLKVYEHTLDANGKKLLGCLVRLTNAKILLLDEKEDIRLGTLAVAMPEFNSRHHVSSVLIGERNAMETKLLAERVSAEAGGIALVSLHSEPLAGVSALVPFMKLAMELIEKSVKEVNSSSSKEVGEAPPS